MDIHFLQCIVSRVVTSHCSVNSQKKQMALVTWKKAVFKTCIELKSQPQRFSLRLKTRCWKKQDTEKVSIKCHDTVTHWQTASSLMAALHGTVCVIRSWFYALNYWTFGTLLITFLVFSHWIFYYWNSYLMV